jgi:hypothetical protein
MGPDPSEGHHTSLSNFEDYPAKAARLSKGEKKRLKSSARRLFEQEGPGSAVSFLAGTRKYTNFRPDALIAKFLAAPVDYERFRPIGALAFQDFLGRDMSEAEFTQAKEYATALGIKDPSAFQSLLTQRIASTPEGQAKIKSEADIMWESQWGTMPRTPDKSLMRGLVAFRPEVSRQIADTLVG